MRIGTTLRLLVLAATALAGAAALGWGQSAAPAKPARVALEAAIEGVIGPATVRHVERAVDIARKRNPEVLILRLSTPGGLATSMREIIMRILASPVPVVGYVAPAGAHAASAGTYILYATQIAAMAPGTNIGAATPVQIGGIPGLPSPGGEKPAPKKPAKGEKGETPAPSEGGTMMHKVMNDAIALIRSLAEMHGRNADWAEKAVREAATLTPKQALDLHVINVIADDVPALLAAIDGRTVTVLGKKRTLETKGLPVEQIGRDWITDVLAVISNPNIAFVLMMVGVYGIIFEFIHPGTVAPGVVGVTCLVLGLYALNQLPLDFAGLALVVLGLGFMVTEALTPSFGVFGIGGIVAFVIGAAMLVDTDVPAYRLSWWTIAGTAGASGTMLVLLLGYVWRIYWRRPKPHGAGIVGKEGHVLDWSGGEGHVWAEGERWSARSEAGLAAGETVRIRELDGLTLVVGPTAEHAAAAEPRGAERGA